MTAKNEPTRQILNNGSCQVVDGDEQFQVQLPEWMHLLDSDLDDLESLTEAIGRERLLALAHKGLVQAVIDVRAKARYKDKHGNYTGNPQAYEPSLLPKPGKSKAEKALEDLTPEQLQELLKKKGLV